MALDPTQITVTVLGLAGTLGVSFIALRSAASANKTAERVGEKKADRETYETAKGYWESLLAESRKDRERMQRDMEEQRQRSQREIEAHRARLDELQIQLNRRDATADRLAQEVDQLREELRSERAHAIRLQHRVMILESALVTGGIPIPSEAIERDRDPVEGDRPLEELPKSLQERRENYQGNETREEPGALPPPEDRETS